MVRGVDFLMVGHLTSWVIGSQVAKVVADSELQSLVQARIWIGRKVNSLQLLTHIC